MSKKKDDNDDIDINIDVKKKIFHIDNIPEWGFAGLLIILLFGVIAGIVWTCGGFDYKDEKREIHFKGRKKSTKVIYDKKPTYDLNARIPD